MAERPLYVGVDWRDGTWFAVAFDPTGFDHAAAFEEVGGVWLRYEELAERILVDVPIGLREDGDADRRPDALARDVLGDRATAIVTPPVREATRKRRYPAAKRVVRRKTGRDLSRRAFALAESIAPLDELLRELPEARPVVSEAHPEVCLRAFAGDPLEHAPATAAGYAERMRVLAEFDRDAPPTVQSVAEATADVGADVTIEGVLDALALAYTARPGPGKLRSLPADPETDDAGLPMRTRYRAATPLAGD
jgi:predicted RNase H-like nuclease